MHKKLIALFLISAVLLPPITVIPMMPILRPEMLVVGYALAFGGRRMGIDLRRPDPIWKVLLWLIPVALLAIWSSYLFFNTPINYRDFMVLPMLLQYWLAYCFARSIQRPDIRIFAVRTFVNCIGVSALVGIAQKFNLASVNSWLTPLYKSRQLDALTAGAFYGRSVGTVGDPRHYAYFLALGIAAALVLQIFCVRSTAKRISGLTILGATFLALVLTASRTGGVVLLVSIALVVRFSVKKTGNTGGVLAFAVISGVVAITLWSTLAPEETKERLTATEGASYEHSLHARQRDAMEPFKKGMNNPIIFITGRGPSKSVLSGSEHSEMGWWLLRYGFLGLGCYLYILIGGIRQGLRRFRMAPNPGDAAVTLFTMVAMVGWLMFAQAESIFKLPQLMSVNIFILGLSYAPVRFPRYPMMPPQQPPPRP